MLLDYLSVGELGGSAGTVTIESLLLSMRFSFYESPFISDFSGRAGEGVDSMYSGETNGFSSLQRSYSLQILHLLAGRWDFQRVAALSRSALTKHEGQVED